MQRILVLYTGGTLGMKKGKAGWAPAPGALTDELITRWSDVDVVELDPLLDSSSMGPSDWRALAERIQPAATRYRGVVVLHGTDTLAYTAAALAYQLGGLGAPVVLTAAMRSWFADGESDARAHIEQAIALAGAGQPGVFVAFGGRAYLGTRVRKLDASGMDAFASPNAPAVAHWQDGSWHFDCPEVPSTTGPVSLLDPAKRVVALQLAPGATVAWLAQQLHALDTDGCVLVALGAGNLPDHAALNDAVKALCARMPVVIATPCWRGEVELGSYAASAALVAAGALSAGDMTPEAALVKLQWLLSRADADDVRTDFLSVVAGDRTEKRTH
ncbi:asparaginase [Chitinibacteraceae bacterium HSL-7]